jgi:integrase
MPRRSEGWTLYADPRNGVQIVRFRHDGRRHHISTRETDPARAKQAAQAIYAEVVSGRRWQPAGARNVRLFELICEWVAALEVEVPDTVSQYRVIGFAHVEPFFGDTGRLTEAGFADYIRARLRRVQRSTVRAEMVAIRRLCRWLHERGYLDTLPAVPAPPKGARGTVHAAARNRKRVDLTPGEVDAIIAHLPERSRGVVVRAYFVAMAETGLRRGTLDRIRVPEHYTRGAELLTLTPDVDKSRWGRPLPLTTRAREALDSCAPDVGLIFGSHDLRVALKHAARDAGIADWQAIGCHDLRHARLTELAHGGDLMSAAYLAGHRHVSTTDRYLHPRLAPAAALIRATDRATVSHDDARQSRSRKR